MHHFYEMVREGFVASCVSGLGLKKHVVFFVEKKQQQIIEKKHFFPNQEIFEGNKAGRRRKKCLFERAGVTKTTKKNT